MRPCTNNSGRVLLPCEKAPRNGVITPTDKCLWKGKVSGPRSQSGQPEDETANSGQPWTQILLQPQSPHGCLRAGSPCAGTLTVASTSPFLVNCMLQRMGHCSPSSHSESTRRLAAGFISVCPLPPPPAKETQALGKADSEEGRPVARQQARESGRPGAAVPPAPAVLPALSKALKLPERGLASPKQLQRRTFAPGRGDPSPALRPLNQDLLPP